MAKRKTTRKKSPCVRHTWDIDIEYEQNWCHCGEDCNCKDYAIVSAICVICGIRIDESEISSRLIELELLKNPIV